jgi:hypothetical protein
MSRQHLLALFAERLDELLVLLGSDTLIEERCE